jgi:hypothetical protein
VSRSRPSSVHAAVRSRLRLSLLAGLLVVALAVPAQAAAASQNYKGTFTQYSKMAIGFNLVVKNGVKKLRSFNAYTKDPETTYGFPVKCNEGTWTWTAQGIISPARKLENNAWSVKSTDTSVKNTTTFAGKLTNGGRKAEGFLKFSGNMYRGSEPTWHNCYGKFAWTASRQ